MGILLHRDSGRCVTLPGHCLVGRTSSCFLRLEGKTVSSEHARIRWSEAGWEIRDLGSRNGTLIDGQPLGAGQSAILTMETEIAFGDEDGWQLIDEVGPIATARSLRTGRMVYGVGGVLRFGEDEGRFPYIFAKGERWLSEESGGLSLVRDGEVVEVDGEPWRLHLPSGPDSTVDARGGPSTQLSDLSWCFAVSSDEEYVQLKIRRGQEVTDLGSRAHHYLLLTLARLRAEGGEGWVYADELERMLGLDTNTLNVQIYRARTELGKLGVTDAPEIIERRRPTRQIRTMIENFEISRI